MVRATNIRTCAYTACGQPFAPAHASQRYCEPAHSQLARDARTRRCKLKSCRVILETADVFVRFCSDVCRSAYLEKRKLGAKKVVRLPIAVLLPTGCAPYRVQGTQDAPGSTIASMAGLGYGEIARRVFCAHYERCLSWVISKHWGGWDCRTCEVEQPVIPELRSKRGNWEP